MSSDEWSRRGFLRDVAFTAGVVIAGAARVAAERPPGESPPPKEGGLSSEGLLAGRPGFQPRTVAPLPHEELPGLLSRAQLAANYAEYVRACEKLKSAEQALATADRSAANAAAYAALRRTQIAAANDALLHEFYFSNLVPKPVAMPRYVERNLREHMSSPESWAADFTACARMARAWAVLVYDPYDDRWHNTIMDSADDGVWIGANPLVVCDVAEHAYSTDYQRREEYIARFLEHLDWDEVARRYHRVDRM